MALTSIQQRLDTSRVDRFGAVEGNAQTGKVKHLLGPVEAPGHQCPREVGSCGHRAAVIMDPLHPSRWSGCEVLGGSEHQSGT